MNLHKDIVPFFTNKRSMGWQNPEPYFYFRKDYWTWGRHQTPEKSEHHSAWPNIDEPVEGRSQGGPSTISNEWSGNWMVWQRRWFVGLLLLAFTESNSGAPNWALRVLVKLIEPDLKLGGLFSNCGDGDPWFEVWLEVWRKCVIFKGVCHGILKIMRFSTKYWGN